MDFSEASQMREDRRKTALKTAQGLMMVSQISISFLMPILLGVWASKRLVKHRGLSEFWIIAAVIAGIAIGASSVYSLLRKSFISKSEASSEQVKNDFEKNDDYQ